MQDKEIEDLKKCIENFNAMRAIFREMEVALNTTQKGYEIINTSVNTLGPKGFMAILVNFGRFREKFEQMGAILSDINIRLLSDKKRLTHKERKI